VEQCLKNPQRQLSAALGFTDSTNLPQKNTEFTGRRGKDMTTSAVIGNCHIKA
jgi:hypothetical protein